jgi:hypothetical protein
LNRKSLRELWHHTHNDFPCEMLDGKIGLLIRGPAEGAVPTDEWRFGFQVYGEADIRWRKAEQIELGDDGLIEIEEARRAD